MQTRILPLLLGLLLLGALIVPHALAQQFPNKDTAPDRRDNVFGTGSDNTVLQQDPVTGDRVLQSKPREDEPDTEQAEDNDSMETNVEVYPVIIPGLQKGRKAPPAKTYRPRGRR